MIKEITYWIKDYANNAGISALVVGVSLEYEKEIFDRGFMVQCVGKTGDV